MTSVATGLLRRDDLLAALDRASLRKVTVISAPPGSGKTSLLRAWSDRASEDRRVALRALAHRRRDQRGSDRVHPDPVGRVVRGERAREAIDAYERALEDAVRAHRRERWLSENRPAIDAYNEQVDEHGTFADTLRSF